MWCPSKRALAHHYPPRIGTHRHDVCQRDRELESNYQTNAFGRKINPGERKRKWFHIFFIWLYFLKLYTKIGSASRRRWSAYVLGFWVSLKLRIVYLQAWDKLFTQTKKDMIPILKPIYSTLFNRHIYLDRREGKTDPSIFKLILI